MSSVQILVSDKRFYNDVTNGPGLPYTANPTYFQPTFRGQVMQTMRFQCVIEISKTYNMSALATVVKDVAANTLFMTFDKWAEQGFQVGDVIRLPNGAGPTFDCEITDISPDDKTATYTVVSGSEGANVTLNSEQIRWVANNQSNYLTALRVRFALNPSAQGFQSNNSMITGQPQSYFSENIGVGVVRSTSPVPMLSLGLPKWWVDQRDITAETGSTVRFVSATDFVQVYEFSHMFVVGPWFLAGQLTALQAGAPPSYFEGPNTLDYFASFEFFRNTTEVSQTTPFLGSIFEPGDIGWFGENFNGRPSTTTVNSFQILLPDLSPFSTAELPLFTQQVFADFQVRPNGGHIFQAGNRVNVYFSYLPASQDEYRSDLAQRGRLFRNFGYDWVEMEIGTTEGTAIPSTGGNSLVFGSCKAWISGSNIQVRCTINPIGDSISKPFALGSGSRAILAVGSENTTQAFTGGGPSASKLTTTLAGPVLFYEQITNIGGFTMTDSGFYLQNQFLPPAIDADENLAIPSPDTWDEDSIVHEAFIELDATAGVIVDKIRAQVISTDGTNTIVLDSFEFDTAPAVIVDGAPNFALSSSRGYSLADGKEIFNLCQIATLDRTLNLQKYVLRYATRLSYQSWLQNLTVPTSFFDSAEPQNNRNFQTSRYSNAAGYVVKVKYMADFSSLGPGGQVDQSFTFESDPVTVRTYGQSSPAGYAGMITTRDPDTLADLGGQIYADRNTLFEVVWTVPSGVLFGDLSIWHRLEPEFNPSFVNIEDLYMDPNPQPTGTRSLQSPQMTAISPTQIRSTCIIVGSLLNSGAAFKLSARIESGGGNTSFRVTENFEIRNTDTGTNFRIV